MISKVWFRTLDQGIQGNEYDLSIALLIVLTLFYDLRPASDHDQLSDDEAGKVLFSEDSSF